MNKPIPFFVVSEEENFINSMKSLLNKVFPKSFVYTSIDGVYVVDFIGKNDIPLILITEINVVGLNGFQICKKAKETDEKNHRYVIIITGNNDKDMNLKAIQSGADDFLNKPFGIDEIVTKLRVAQKIVNLNVTINENKAEIKRLNEEIEKDTEKMISILKKFQEAKFPHLEKTLNFFKEACEYVAYELLDEQTELNNILKAVDLIFIGKVFLPDNLLNTPVMSDGFVRGATMEKVPYFAKDMLDGIRGYEEVANILFHIWENFDGSGIPEKIQGWQIPLGSRILRVILDYYELVNYKKVGARKAVEILELESRRLYDYRIVTLFDQFLASKGIGSTEKEAPIRPREMVEDMVLTRSIITNSGLKILGAGTVLDEENIQKIINIIETDPIIGKIWVKSI